LSVLFKAARQPSAGQQPPTTTAVGWQAATNKTLNWSGVYVAKTWWRTIYLSINQKLDGPLLTLNTLPGGGEADTRGSTPD